MEDGILRAGEPVAGVCLQGGQLPGHTGEVAGRVPCYVLRILRAHLSPEYQGDDDPEEYPGQEQGSGGNQRGHENTRTRVVQLGFDKVPKRIGSVLESAL